MKDITDANKMCFQGCENKGEKIAEKIETRESVVTAAG